MAQIQLHDLNVSSFHERVSGLGTGDRSISVELSLQNTFVQAFSLHPNVDVNYGFGTVCRQGRMKAKVSPARIQEQQMIAVSLHDEIMKKNLHDHQW